MEHALKAQFLIAMPGLADPNFHQTVTYMCEHTDEGAVGIVLNRAHSNLSAEHIFKELELEPVFDAQSIPVYSGGPVNTNQIFVLHGPPFDWEGCFPVSPSIALSNTVDLLRALAEGKGPPSYLLCIGCAGWGPGQLEFEIKENVWLTSSVWDDIIFKVPVELRWQTAVERMGIDPTLLSDAAGHA